MPISTVTSKGQITIPQTVREALGLQTGDKIDFVQQEPGTYKVVALRRDARSLRGRFAGRVRQAASIEQMADAIATEIEQRAGATKTRRRSKHGKST